MQGIEVRTRSKTARAHALVVLIVLGSTLFFSCADKSTNQNNSSPPRNTTPIQVSSSDLIKAYDNNVVAADYHFTDKLVSVTGIVLDIQRYPDFIQVKLKADDPYQRYILCVFNNDRFEDVVPLNKDELATIKGVCQGVESQQVVLKDCFISNSSIPQRTRGVTLPPIQPSPASSAPSTFGATARCRDGTLSYSQHHQGTCSHHGGVAEWLD